MSYKILSLDQIEGPNSLEIFDKIGADAEVTDFARYRGAESFPLKGKYFAAKGLKVESPILDKKSAKYWTSTKVPGSISKCYSYGKIEKSETAAWDDNIGIRVCVPINEIKSEMDNIEEVDYGHGEVKVAQYGEYPQDFVSPEERKKLDAAFEDGDMKPTAKSYSTWGYRTQLYYDGVERHFEQVECPEYEFNGRKYALVQPAVFEGDARLDRGYTWIEVKPIEWYLDEKSGLAVSKNILMGGLPMSRKGIYLNNFENTIISDFLNDEFALDLKLIYNKKELIEEMLEKPEEATEDKTKTL